MADLKHGTPAALIKAVLGCDDETAVTVQKNLGGIMNHEPTRAFVAKTWHLSVSTRPPKSSRDDVLINEGKRQAGLFLVACNQSGMQLGTYSEGNAE